jgi:anti-sigma B factor antagonist
MMPENRYEVVHVGNQNEVVVVTVHGYIDSTTSPGLAEIVEKQLAQEKYKFVINLKDVDYISSVGWGVFIGNLKDIRAHHGDLVLTNMCTNVHNIFELMEFSSVIKDFDDVSRALFYFLGSMQAVSEGENIVEAPEDRPEESAREQQPYYTVIEDEPAIRVSRRTMSAYNDEVVYTPEHRFERDIVRVILDKPYINAKKIAKALKLPQYGGVKRSKKAVQQELVKLGLDTPEKRYAFALRNR